MSEKKITNKELTQIFIEVLANYHDYVQATILSQTKQGYYFLMFVPRVLKKVVLASLLKKDCAETIPNIIIDELNTVMTKHLGGVLDAQQEMKPSADKLIKLSVSEEFVKETLRNALDKIPKENLPQC